MATAKKKTRKRASKKTTKAQEQPTVDVDKTPPLEGTPMSGDLIVMEDGEPMPAFTNDPEVNKFVIAKRIAYMLSNSSLVPEAFRGRAADCFIAIQMGAELGLGPFQSVQSIAVIHGTPSIWGDALIGVVRASPHCEWIDETFDDGEQTATCTTQRKGEPKSQTRTFSMADAKTAGIANKDIWKKYPKRMLQMRARAFCLRDVYPDVLKGLKVAEEMMDIHGSPAPITDYELPPSPKPEAKPTLPADAPPTTAADADEPTKTDDPDKVTLAQVEKLIRNADDMASLLNASNAAKLLENENDILVARTVYQQKRRAILQRDFGNEEQAPQR